MNENESIGGSLEEEGWSKRFAACEPRLSEAVEMYQDAGFEVYLLPLPKGPERDSCVGTEPDDGCRVCYEGAEDLYKIIFTKKKERGAGAEEDLF